MTELQKELQRRRVAKCLVGRRKRCKEQKLCRECCNPLDYVRSIVMCRSCCLKRSPAYRKWMKVAV